MIYIYLTIMLLIQGVALLDVSLNVESDVDIVQQDEMKFIQIGETLTLTCTFSSYATTTAWFKQSAGEKTLLIASAYHNSVKLHPGLANTSRFSAFKKGNKLTLNIANAELSDSATYICAVECYNKIMIKDCTVSVLRGLPASQYAVLQNPPMKSATLGDNVTLQCTVVAESCAGEHSVFWIRHGSGESHPGIIYTHGDSSDQCKNRSDAGSSTQSCIYSLPKRNLSTSDAGTYYCAVATCGEILYGKGTKLEIKENGVFNPTIFVLATLNVVLLLVIFILCRKLCYTHHRDDTGGHASQGNKVENSEALHYAAISFAHDSFSRKTRVKSSSDVVYGQINPHE